MNNLKIRTLYTVMTLAIIVGMCGFMTAKATAASNLLDTASEWARESIESAVSKGFVPIDIQNNYTSVITRAEFCRMAVKYLEYSTGKDMDVILAEKGLSLDLNAFTDTNDPDILAAFALGITSGIGDNQFAPNAQFSREQAATMIMNTQIAMSADVSSTSSSGFSDIDSASNWAVSSIDFVFANGIMQGTGNNMFSPQAPYTREQSIITFSNMADTSVNTAYDPALLGTWYYTIDTPQGAMSARESVTFSEDGNFTKTTQIGNGTIEITGDFTTTGENIEITNIEYLRSGSESVTWDNKVIGYFIGSDAAGAYLCIGTLSENESYTATNDTAKFRKK